MQQSGSDRALPQALPPVMTQKWLQLRLLWCILNKGLIFHLKPCLLCCTWAHEIWKGEFVFPFSVRFMERGGGGLILPGMLLSHGLVFTMQGNPTQTVPFGVLLGNFVI